MLYCWCIWWTRVCIRYLQVTTILCSVVFLVHSYNSISATSWNMPFIPFTKLEDSHMPSVHYALNLHTSTTRALQTIPFGSIYRLLALLHLRPYPHNGDQPEASEASWPSGGLYNQVYKLLDNWKPAHYLPKYLPKYLYIAEACMLPKATLDT